MKNPNVSVGDWCVASGVLPSTPDRLVYIKNIKCEEDGYSVYAYYWTRPSTGVSHIGESHTVRLLTDEERKNLDIYFSGDFEKYPLIINDKFLREAVIQTMKTGTKPRKDGYLLYMGDMTRVKPMYGEFKPNTQYAKFLGTGTEFWRNYTPCFNFELNEEELINEAVKRGFIVISETGYIWENLDY